MKKFLKNYWPLLLFVLLVLVITTRFIAPAPPRTLKFAAGSASGAYTLTAQQYQESFKDNNFTLEVLTTTGSGDNLKLLREGKVGAAIVQGGISSDEDREYLKSIGAIFYEPLWVFYRSDVAPAGMNAGDMRTLEGLRVAAGSPTSGTRILAQELMGENGVTANVIGLGGQAAADALRANEIDVFIAVTAPNALYIDDLLADPEINVLSFERALAYERRTPYLKRVIFPEGGLDLAQNLPDQPIELIAPIAEVVVREDLHPDLQVLLLEAMMDVHRGGTLLSEPGVFPTPDRVDLPLSKEAERYYERGPSFLHRMFPFSVANFLERAWVLAIPLLTLIIPLVRAAPPIYRWRTRRKIYIWYKDLRELETRGRAAKSNEERNKIRNELNALQAEVGRVEVPESYTDELYRLRSHVLFVNQLIGNLDDKTKHIKTVPSST